MSSNSSYAMRDAFTKVHRYHLLRVKQQGRPLSSRLKSIIRRPTEGHAYQCAAVFSFVFFVFLRPIYYPRPTLTLPPSSGGDANPGSHCGRVSPLHTTAQDFYDGRPRVMPTSIAQFFVSFFASFFFPSHLLSP